MAVHVEGHPDASQNGIFYLHADHLGSHTVQTNRATGQKVAASEARFYPFGGYRTAPTEPLTGRGYTGHRHNDDLGLIYMNARYYVPGIGRFASADTIVPDPTNPQAYNRYSYVLNNPLKYTDPTGHLSECSLLGDGNDVGGCQEAQRLSSLRRDSLEPPLDILTHLPLDREVITWQSGFGPNWYATDYCDQMCYGASSNIHTGLDFFAPAGSTVFATASGEIVDIYPTDGDPNVVIKVTVGSIAYYVVHGHVEIDAAIRVQIDAGEKVEARAGDVIGTLEDLEGNSHVHLGIRRKTTGQDRAYNPLLFMDSTLTVGMKFVSETYPYYGNESPTSIRSFLYGADSYYEEANRWSMGIIR